jgi:hypothetical protein
MDYFLYNAIRALPHYGERGVMRVPSVMHSAWKYRDEKLGFLFVNLRKERSQELTLEINPSQYGFPEELTYRMEVISGANREPLANLSGRAALQLTLPP